MKTNRLLIILSISLALLSSCNTDYNTNFSPPPQNPKHSDVFSETINDMKANVVGIESDVEGIQGFNAIYGENSIVISAYQTPSKEAADAYFKDKIVPIFDDMSSHSRGNINGQWYASGTEGNKKAYGWVNSNWIFIITADSEENFNAAIDDFKFIAIK